MGLRGVVSRLEVVMHRLAWRQTDDGYVCNGYRLFGGGGAMSWILHAPGSNGAIRRNDPPIATSHPSATDAMAWAQQLERDEVNRLQILTHFSISAVSLVGFVLLANVIGSLAGLVAVATAFYAMLRSAANGVGLLLNDAWGWTRSGPSRLSLMERVVARLASGQRRRALNQTDTADVVRVLEPA